MADNYSNKNPQPGKDQRLPDLPLSEFDPGSKSLAEALRISFIVLKGIMILLVAAFIGSGFFTVERDENAIVMRFGRIRGVGEDAIKGPGLWWSFPHPIDEVVKIPVQKVQTLAIDDFWYFETEQERLGGRTFVDISQPLLPQRDGYVLTRNDRVEGLPAAGYDYSIVHCKWVLTYRISNPLDFFRNVYIGKARPGEDFHDVAGATVNPLLRSVAAKAIVATMVDFTVDEALVRTDSIAIRVRDMMSRELMDMRTGITIDTMQLVRVTWPRQVDAHFQGLIGARQESERVISEARGNAERTLNEAGGPVTSELLAQLMQGEAVPDEVWDQLAGEAQRILADARAYRTKVVENARARSEFMQSLLPEYRKRPELVLQKIYRDAIEEVMMAADEKIFVQRDPAAGEDSEVRIMINSDPVREQKTQDR